MEKHLKKNLENFLKKKITYWKKRLEIENRLNKNGWFFCFKKKKTTTTEMKQLREKTCLK